MASETIGRVKCPWCGSQKASVSVSKSGLCCVVCRACHCQTFARGAYSDLMIRGSMTPVDTAAREPAGVDSAALDPAARAPAAVDPAARAPAARAPAARAPAARAPAARAPAAVDPADKAPDQKIEKQSSWGLW